MKSEIGERIGKVSSEEVCVPSKLEAESEHSGAVNAGEHRHDGGSNPVDGEHHVASAESGSQHGSSITERREEPLWE